MSIASNNSKSVCLLCKNSDCRAVDQLNGLQLRELWKVANYESQSQLKLVEADGDILVGS